MIQYYYKKKEEVKGPIGLEELIQKAVKGKIKADTKIKVGEDSQWQKAKKIEGLRYFFAAQKQQQVKKDNLVLIKNQVQGFYLTNQNLIKKISSIVLGLFFVIFIGYHFFSYPNFDVRTFMGKTKMNTVIALEISSKDGELIGEGFHYFPKNDIKNNVRFKYGTIDRFGEFSVFQNHIESEKMFGTLKGEISDDFNQITGEWTNENGKDRTVINLTYTSKTPDEIFNTIPRGSNVKDEDWGTWFNRQLRDAGNYLKKKGGG